jgi:hypothetical protein
MGFAVRRLVAVMALVTMSAGAARAADVSALRASILAAMTATGSFVMDVANPQGIYGSAIVQTQAGRAKISGSAGEHTLTVYAVNGYEYQQIDGSAWQRRKLPAGAAMLVAPLTGAVSITPQPDARDASGTTFGAFEALTSLPVPGIGTTPNVTLDCTYDKTTMLLHVCTSQYATLTFHNYNDPKNVVELPAQAKDAPELAPLDAGGFSTGR